VTEFPTTPVTIGLVKGLLTPILAENVNYVNAMVLAKERGIKITESRSSEASAFANLVHVTLRTDRERRSIAGTLYSKHDPRIVLIDELRVELEAKGYVLCIWNKDVPGMVGYIGTILGRNRVNIADMTVGRMKPGGRARTLVSIDSPVSEAVLRKIRASKKILDAKLIKL
jgi:D-3-phosphoglycerate dehydrogenase